MSTLNADLDALHAFIEGRARLFVITGAGVSTDSGIPDYRDANGEWKRTPPVTFQAFTGDDTTRRRYWARSLVGWSYFRRARPNAAHRVLAALEARGKIQLLLTQNVDGLHQAAGSERVIDLHGRLDTVRCLRCEARTSREDFQQALLARNPGWAELDAGVAPDGDADLDGRDFASFDVPDCATCAGMLKPDVVFFGENVPRERVIEANHRLSQSDAVLVAGTSLMVYSGYRFVQAAARLGLPIAAINLGRTRADGLLSLKVEAAVAQTLALLPEDKHTALSADA